MFTIQNNSHCKAYNIGLKVYNNYLILLLTTYEDYLIFLLNTILSRRGRGLYFFGIDSHVFRPIITAFCFPVPKRERKRIFGLSSSFSKSQVSFIKRWFNVTYLS